MKKLLIILAMLLFAAGCASFDQDDGRSDKGSMVNGQYPQDYNPNSAMNTLEYFGLYLPNEGCQTNLLKSVQLLPENSYVMVFSDGSSTKGMFSWDETGTVIHMLRQGQKDMTFWVGKGVIKESKTGELYYQQQK